MIDEDISALQAAMNDDRFDQLDKLHTTATEIFGKAIAKESAKTGVPSPCGDKCPACCREPVYASRLEAERIVALMDEARKEVIREKLTFWLAGFYGTGQHKVERPSVYEYIPSVPPCPLLDKDGRCSVYEHRPLECRAHFAMKHRSYCEDLAKRREQKHALFGDDLMMILCVEHMHIENGILMDHLCVHLAEILLGAQPETEARVNYIAEFAEEEKK